MVMKRGGGEEAKKETLSLSFISSVYSFKNKIKSVDVKIAMFAASHI